MTRPLLGSGSAGLPVTRLSPTYLTAGTSPRTGTFQLPSYGWWLVEVSAAYSNTNNIGSLMAMILYYNGVSGTKALKTTTIAPAVFSAGTDLSSLTLSDPDSSGLVTVTVGWTTTATSRTPWTRVILRQLTDASIAESP
jgi:hypothetical protein